MSFSSPQTSPQMHIRSMSTLPPRAALRRTYPFKGKRSNRTAIATEQTNRRTLIPVRPCISADGTARRAGACCRGSWARASLGIAPPDPVPRLAVLIRVIFVWLEPVRNPTVLLAPCGFMMKHSGSVVMALVTMIQQSPMNVSIDWPSGTGCFGFDNALI